MATCSECTYMKVNGDEYYGKYWCEYHCDWRYANEEKCYNFCTAYTRGIVDTKRAFDRSKESQESGGGCFITTALCNILSMPDDNKYLNILRKFRKDYLQKNEKGLEILVAYDEIGPQISKSLFEYNGKMNMSLILFQNYIMPITNMITENKYEEAISSYTEMTKKLINFFHVDDTIKTSINEIEPTMAGHGKLVKKMQSKSLV